MINYSIVVPFYNEENNIEPLYREIEETMNKMHSTYEVIFVDDGSTDKTKKRIEDIENVNFIRFRRNYGQTAALDAGFKASNGEVIIAMDGDGQNPPGEIPKLIEKLNEGFDVVSGWRYKRKDPILKHIASRCANIARQWLVHDGIHDSGCSLKVYRKKTLQNLNLYGESHRFIPALLKIQGYKIGEVKVDHRARLHGKTKYNWKRGIKGMVDMIGIWFWRKYASRPLHIFGGGGFIMGWIGTLLLFVLFIMRVMGKISLVNSIWPLIAIFLILVGIQLFVSGLLADILVKNHFGISKKTYYEIEKQRKAALKQETYQQ